MNVMHGQDFSVGTLVRRLRGIITYQHQGHGYYVSLTSGKRYDLWGVEVVQVTPEPKEIEWI